MRWKLKHRQDKDATVGEEMLTGRELEKVGGEVEILKCRGTDGLGEGKMGDVLAERINDQTCEQRQRGRGRSRC